ncbi:MAG TPA: hypothetical protein VFE46_11280 [Pirellulales bacterium]|nr:hypothetical protein [Pirellulales bacterium]
MAETPAPPPSAISQQPEIRTLKRVAPRAVNLKARLSDSVADIEIQGQSLADFLSLVSAMSTIPITLDVDALHDMGQSAAMPVQLHLSDASVAELLQSPVESLRLGYQFRDGQLIVGYPPQEKLRQVRYAVPDLAGTDPQALSELAALVKQMVAPGSWQSPGGKATLVVSNGALLIEQTEPAHAQILDLCERLRVARGLPLKSHYDPARFVLTSRETQARELLQKPVNANFSTPQPLAQVMEWLSRTTGATIVINHAALAQEGTSADSECAAVAVNTPLEKLLDNLTASADLTWRAIDRRTIEITSHPAAREQMDTEFYAARDLAPDTATSKKLIKQIMAKIEPQLWNADSNAVSANDAVSRGVLHFDIPSGALIVRAPQRVQSQVEAALASARQNK